MTPRIVVSTLLVGILVGIAGIAAACGGGDGDGEVTLEEYFGQLEAIASDIDTRLEPLQADLEGAVDDPTVIGDVFVDYVAIIRDAGSSVDNLNPPMEVEEAHNRFRDAIAALGDEFDGVAGQLGEVQSAEDVLGVLGESETRLSATQDELESACNALQVLADAAEISADLQCE